MKWLYHDWVNRHKDKFVPRGEEIQISSVEGVEVSKCNNCERCRHCLKDRGEEIAINVAYCISEFSYLMDQCERETIGGCPIEDAFSLPARRTLASSPRPSTTTRSRPALRSQRPKILLKEQPVDPDFRQPGSTTDANVIPQKILASGVTFKFKQLDAALKEAIELGWPDWVTTGEGGSVSRGKTHDFSWMKLKFGARIDFFRGASSDDLRSPIWQVISEKLPRYTEYLMEHQNPQSPEGVGNAMEQAAGVSFAAATYGTRLPKNAQLKWDSIEQHAAWLRVWCACQALGLKPRLDEPRQSDEEEDQRVQRHRESDRRKARQSDEEEDQRRQRHRESDRRRARQSDEEEDQRRQRH